MSRTITPKKPKIDEYLEFHKRKDFTFTTKADMESALRQVVETVKRLKAEMSRLSYFVSEHGNFSALTTDQAAKALLGASAWLRSQHTGAKK